MDRRSNARVQEQLVSLYLRLNGFFVTGFVVHSPIHGRNKTEIDALALRLPFSSEPERRIGPDARLDLSAKYADLLICEVKSRREQLQFNSPLRTDPNAVATVLRWCGLFEEAEIAALATSICSALAPHESRGTAPPTVVGPRSTRVRAVMFSPERNSRRPNQPWFLTGPDVVEYVHQCLCPTDARPTCATTYDFQTWGDYEPIVRYFKETGNRKPGNVQDLYSFLDESGGKHPAATTTQDASFS